MSELTPHDGGVTLTVGDTTAVGLGSTDVHVTLKATGETVATCRNPSTGEHRPPGHNPAPTTVTSSRNIPQSEIKNGKATFTVTSQPVTVVPGAPDCPNPSWTEEILDLRFTSFTIIVARTPGGLAATGDAVTTNDMSEEEIWIFCEMFSSTFEERVNCIANSGQIGV